MTSPTRDSPTKRARIEDAAAALFAERGYEQTDLHAVAKASGAAIGSICHYFGSKGGLAATVYKVAAGRLIALVEEAIHDQRITRDYAVRQLINTCHEWNVRHPTDRKVIAALAPHVVEPDGPSIPSLEVRLGEILAAWAKRFVDAHQMRPLSPGLLYAVILAPVMCGVASGPPGSNDENANDPLGWLGCLADAAIAGITPSTAAPTPPSLRKPRRKSPKSTPRRQMGDDEFKLT